MKKIFVLLILIITSQVIAQTWSSSRYVVRVGWSNGAIKPDSAGIATAIRVAELRRQQGGFAIVEFEPGVYDLGSYGIKMKDSVIIKADACIFKSTSIKGTFYDDSTKVTSIIHGYIKVENTNGSAYEIVLKHPQSLVDRVNINPEVTAGGGLPESAVKQIAGDSSNAALAKAKEAIEDSFDVNSRGWQNFNDINNLITGLQSSIYDLTIFIDALGENIESLNNEIVIIKNDINNLFNLVGGAVLDPSPPTNLTASGASSSSVNISWTAPSSLFDSTLIEYNTSVTTDAWATLVKLDSGITSYTHTGRQPKTNYWYRARTFRYVNGTAIYSTYSNEDSATTFDLPALPKIYVNAGDNLTGFTLARNGNSTITTEPTGGNPDNYLRFSYDGSLSNYAVYNLGTSYDSIWVAFDVFLPDTFYIDDATTNQSIGLMDLRNNTNTAFSLQLRGNTSILANQWRVNGVNGITRVDNTNGFTTSQWLRVNIFCNFTAGHIKVYAGNSLVTEQYGLTMTYTSMDNFRLLSNSILNSSGIIKIDNIVISRDSGATGSSTQGQPTTSHVRYVSATTTPGNGTQTNPYTLWQALTAVVPGDTVIMFPGLYDITNNSINFSVAGKVDSPIVWIGTNKNWGTENATGDSSTLIYGNNSVVNTRMTVSGDYNQFYNIVFLQGQPKQLISIAANNITFDSCSFKYPSNISNSSNHLITSTNGKANNLTIRYCHFYHSPRTALWILWSTSAPTNIVLENNYWTGHSNHPPFQIMPYTTAVSPPKASNIHIRNNTFIDNPYGVFFLRHTNDAYIYNNLFIRSYGLGATILHPVEPTDTVSNILIAYNTWVSNSSNAYFNSDEAAQGVIIKNNLIYGTTAWYGNILFSFRCNGYSGVSTPYPPILRHNISNNLYYNTAYSNLGETARVYWSKTSCGLLNYTYNQWKSATGLDNNSLITAPTFYNTGLDDYRPLNASSPQVNAGTPITTGAGYPISITTDKNGNSRNASTPTIGAFEYVP